MNSRPTIIGLRPNEKLGAFCNCINRRHLIGVALMLLGLLSLSLLIAVIIQTANPEHNNNDNNDDQYCLTQGCLSAATHQLRFIDSTVTSTERCTDFYKYACSGWERTHSIQSFDTERTILGDMINRRDRDIERLLNSPIARLTLKSWERKVKVCTVLILLTIK